MRSTRCWPEWLRAQRFFGESIDADWSSCTRRSSWTTTAPRTITVCGSRSTPQVHHVNPTCGDEVTLRVALRGGDDAPDIGAADRCGTSPTTRWAVRSPRRRCRCSPTSRSGRRSRPALERVAAFNTMVTSRGTDAGDEDVLGDGVAFAGVSKYPNRVKCALLGWLAFRTGHRRCPQETLSASGEIDVRRHGEERTMTERCGRAGPAGRRRIWTRPTTAGSESRGFGPGRRRCRRRSIDDDRGGAARRRRPRTGGQHRRPRPAVRPAGGRGQRRHHRHDADQRGLPAHRHDRGAGGRRAARRAGRWWRTSGSTGSGCRRGGRTGSPRTAATSCAPWASTSDPAARHRRPAGCQADAVTPGCPRAEGPSRPPGRESG